MPDVCDALGIDCSSSLDVIEREASGGESKQSGSNFVPASQPRSIFDLCTRVSTTQPVDKVFVN